MAKKKSLDVMTQKVESLCLGLRTIITGLPYSYKIASLEKRLLSAENLLSSQLLHGNSDDIREARCELRMHERAVMIVREKVRDGVTITARRKLIKLCKAFETLQKAVMDGNYTVSEQ